MPASAGPPSREDSLQAYGAGVGLVSVGLGATGVVTYAYFVLASHSLAAADYGRITLLWASVFITASVLYRPVEQLLSRTISEREALGLGGRRHFLVAAALLGAVAAGFVLLALLARGPLEDGLFGGSEALYWILVVTVPAYAGSYFARGVLAGRRRFGLYGGLLLAEAGLRMSFALAVAVGVAAGQSTVALGMAVAPVASLAVILVLAARRALGAASRAVERSASAAERPLADPGELGDAAADPQFTLAHGTGYAGAVLLIMAAEQTFLNAGPLIVNATAAEGAAVAGLVFNALLVVRAPVHLFQAVQAGILPHLTRLRARGRTGAFERSVAVTLRAVVGFAALVTAVMVAVGPALMELFFGSEHAYGRGGLALIAVGMGLYLAAATLTQAALAHGRAGRAAIPWLLGAALFAALMAALGIDDRVLRIEISFLVAALVLCGSLYAIHRRGEPPLGRTSARRDAETTAASPGPSARRTGV